MFDDIGEDCNLFHGKDGMSGVEGYNRDKEFKCSCGAVLVAKYRHALADCNLITTAQGEPLRVASLMPTQADGEIMTEAAYITRVSEMTIDAALSAS